MPLRSAPSGRESEMDGRDSKKGGRQNGFCRPRVKEPQLRSLNVDTAAVSSWHLPQGRTNCCRPDQDAAQIYSWSGVRPELIVTSVTLASTTPTWGRVVFCTIG